MSEGPYSDYSQRFKPGKASRFIGHAESDLHIGDKVVIAARVSERTQDHHKNLDDAAAALDLNQACSLAL